MRPLAPLPLYPSAQARKGLSVSQLAQLHANLLDALPRVIALPPARLDTASTRAFVSSYAGDHAQQNLHALIWEDTRHERHDDRLSQCVLVLAEKIVSSTPGLEPKTLLDLSVAFPYRLNRLRSILSAALDGTPDLPATFASEVVPAFASTLSPSRSLGLYGLRKATYCLTSLLRPLPPALVRPFTHSREFMVALARAYDDGLGAISRSYGGIRTVVADREIDDWERIWLDTKVDIVDAFHLIVTTMAQDISTASGAQLTTEADRAFEIVFTLLDATQESAAPGSADAVPFLNRSLIADYQYAYEASKTLSSALRRTSLEDARMELLETTLRSLDIPTSSGNIKDPGALRLILRSSGLAPAASGKTIPNVQPTSADKGKAKATAPETILPHDAIFDSQVTQVLDVFPDNSPEYIWKLLTHPSLPFRGNPERVIDALLEGTAPSENALKDSFVAQKSNISVAAPATDAPIERRNVFDQETMDLSRVHIGKKTQDVTLLTKDTAETERMKAEILRLAEAMSEDSDEESGARALDILDLDDELDEAGASTIKILDGGEDSGDEDDNEGGGVKPMKLEIILELAYLRDPKLFDRDAQTRRGKPRADLKQQTGWTDEQIEGWRIMLERNPKKDRILGKHEFSGNRTVNAPVTRGIEAQSSDGQRGGGKDKDGGREGGWGRGRGRGRGRGGSRRSGEERNDEVARERAFKERHKSDTRKRGHGKKMARAGGGPSA